MSTPLPPPNTEPDTVSPAVGYDVPLMEEMPVGRESAWRVTGWHVVGWHAAAVGLSVAFLVLCFVLDSVTRVEVPFMMLTTLSTSPHLRTDLCTQKCNTSLFNMENINPAAHFDNNEMGYYLVDGSPFEVTECADLVSYVKVHATNPKTPWRFTDLFFSARCMGDTVGTVYAAAGTFHPHPVEYTLMIRPHIQSARLVSSFAYAVTLMDFAARIAFWALVVALPMQLVWLYITVAMARHSDGYARPAHGGWLRHAFISAVALDAIGLLCVALQCRDANLLVLIFQTYGDYPDVTMERGYYVCLSAMVACVALSLLCTIVGHKLFSSA